VFKASRAFCLLPRLPALPSSLGIGPGPLRATRSARPWGPGRTSRVFDGGTTLVQSAARSISVTQFRLFFDCSGSRSLLPFGAGRSAR
jgi:hypothetical protein